MFFLCHIKHLCPPAVELSCRVLQRNTPTHPKERLVSENEPFSFHLLFPPTADKEKLLITQQKSWSFVITSWKAYNTPFPWAIQHSLNSEQTSPSIVPAVLFSVQTGCAPQTAPVLLHYCSFHSFPSLAASSASEPPTRGRSLQAGQPEQVK